MNRDKAENERKWRIAGAVFRGRMRVFPGEESGNSIVEAVVIAPLLCTLVLGAVEFARLSYAGIELTNAAHAGAQYGSINPVTALDLAGMQAAALKDVTNIAGATATARTSCVCSNGSASTCRATDCTGSRIIQHVQVDTTATVDSLFHYPGSAGTHTLTGHALMRVRN